MRRKQHLTMWIGYQLMLTVLRWHVPTHAYAESDPVLVGAGDIAECWLSFVNGTGGAEATATLLDDIGGTVFTVGDHAYQKGTAEEFRNCYTPTWGRHKARTRPTPGNHDYGTKNAAPYY